MQLIYDILKALIVFFPIGVLLVVVDHKLIVPAIRVLQKKEKRDDPNYRPKGITARHGPQPQFWVATVLTLLSLWPLPLDQSSSGPVVFVSRLVVLWGCFLYAERIVRGWERKEELFASVGRFADGGQQSIRGAIDGIRGKKEDEGMLERLRDFIARSLLGAKKIKEEFLQAQRMEAPPVEPPIAAPAPSSVAAPEAEPEPPGDPRERIRKFGTGLGPPAPKTSAEGGPA